MTAQDRPARKVPMILAGGLLGIVLASIVASWIITAANGRPLFAQGLAALDTVALYGVVGAIIAWRRPGNAMGWLFLAIGVVWTTGRLSEEYAQYALVTRPDSLPGGVVAAWYGEWFWIPALFLTFSFSLLLFPDGSLPSPRWRPFLWFAAASCGATTAIAALERELELASGDVAVRNPIGLMPFDDIEQFAAMPAPLAGICALVALFSLVLRFRRARGDRRQQLKWVAYAATLLVGGFMAMAIVDEMVGQRPPVIDAALFAIVPIAAGLAILRYRLYDIDRIINRTLVYAVLSAVLAGVYALCVVVLPSLAGARNRSDVVVAGSTLLVAALFRPALQRIQAFIDRRFYRSRYDAARTADAFGARLRDQVELDEVTIDLLGVVRHTLQPAHASLWLRSEPGR